MNDENFEARLQAAERAIELLTSTIEKLTATVAAHQRIFEQLSKASDPGKTNYN